MRNIVNEYIELTKKTLTEYMKTIFGSKYDKEISDQYINIYIKIRYYNYKEYDKENTLRRKVFNSLKALRAKMLSQIPHKTEIIEDIYLFYHYILYIDKALWCKDIKEIINKMSLTRIALGLTQNTQFCENMEKLISESDKKIEELLKVEEQETFKLKIRTIDTLKKCYSVSLNYNIKFPEIYSKTSIEKVYETGITKEDKIFIEYYLIGIEIIKDIIKTRFQKQYIVEFATSLFEKPSKLERILSMVENEITQEKLNFKIAYKDLVKYKEDVYTLIRRGYKIAIYLDKDYENTDEAQDRLEIYEYILVDKENEHIYTRLRKDEKLEEKVIAI